MKWYVVIPALMFLGYLGWKYGAIAFVLCAFVYC